MSKRGLPLALLVVMLVSLTFSIVVGAASQGQYCGSKNSDVYHYPSCSYARKIKPENLIWFTDEYDAVSHGYRPCDVCNPPYPSQQSRTSSYTVRSTLTRLSVISFVSSSQSEIPEYPLPIFCLISATMVALAIMRKKSG